MSSLTTSRPNNPNSLPSPVQTFHRDTYPTISPLRPELSLRGKHVVVTGGGSGIGRETVKAFAEAGAARITMLGGRRRGLLEETKKEVLEQGFKGQIELKSVDITDETKVLGAVEEVKEWDILLLNSGYLSEKGDMLDVKVEEWWRAFEVALKGSLIILQALLPKRRPGAAVLATSSIVINLQFTGSSSYIVSKLALTRMMECLAQENSDLHVVSFHPGGVDTDMYNKFFGAQAEKNRATKGTDTLQLPAHFAVWLASAEARYLRGKFVHCNWDVTELAALREKIESTPFLTANIIGWPFSSEV